MPGFPRACLLHSSVSLAEFLPLPLLRLSPIDNTATEIFLHVYGSCICKISMSPLLLSSFVLALFAPFLHRSFLNPSRWNVYIYMCVRAIKTVCFLYSCRESWRRGVRGIYAINKAFSTVRLF